ncbi:MAG: UvrD-helicase domain-containing protein [Sphingobacteriia bacterium]|nr:UvrD-helicase domain-containing protein [Sphingobacteriia bacterium]
MDIDTSNLLENLNPKQLEAITTIDGPLLVLAGAGTGKTKVLTTRIANIIDKRLAFPNQILAVTFTNKAANEMKHRIAQFVSVDGLWIGTFHSICAKILRIHASNIGLNTDFNIIDADDQIRLIKNIMEQIHVDPKKHNPKSILWIINSWKDAALNPNEVVLDKYNSSNANHRIAMQIYKLYQNKLFISNSVDFGDLLLYVVNLFKNNSEILEHYQSKFKYIHVDEYQDTNLAQYILIKMLAERTQNICCVGDDDQSIYGWRGAEVDNILKFSEYYPKAKLIRLEQNYRSTQNILAAASEIIANNKNRLGKTLWSEGNVGEKIFVANLWNDQEEADFCSKISKHLIYNGHEYSHAAVLVRAGFQTRSFEESFVRNSIPYKVIGGLKFYERLEIKDALAYIRVTINNNDDLAFERIINTPKRSIGNTTISQIQNFALVNNVSLFKASEIMIKNLIITGKTAKQLGDLINYFKKWQQEFAEKDHHLVVEDILKESGYIEMWKKQNSLEAQGRLDNLKELYRALQEFNSISEFLEHVSLVNDNNADITGNYISIMTLHAAKGLEFEVVFLPGWEEGIFPSLREGDTANDLEEERRLAYVGLTRAKQKVFITFVARRRIYNSWQDSEPSRFLLELPKAICQSLNYNSISNFGLNKPQSTTEVASPETSSNTLSNTNNVNNNTIKINQRVSHSKFGFGRVIAISGDNVQVVFEKNGIKTIKQEFLKFD